MAHWLIKAAVHRGISALPNRQFWNGLLQKWITRSTELTSGTFKDKLCECARHLRVFRSARSGGDFTVQELGTGWLPTIPLGLWLSGAREIWTFDIEHRLKTERVLGVLGHYCDHARRGALGDLLPEARADRMQKLEAVLAAAKTDEPPGDRRNCFREARFEIIREENVSGAPEDLARVKLAPEFQQVSRADLLVLHSYIAARLKD